MSGIVTRRRLRSRRDDQRGVPWWLIAILTLAGLGVLGAAAGVGTVFAVYQHYADDYEPIEQRLQQRNVGLTTVLDRNGVDLGVLPNPDAQLLQPVSLGEISPHMIEATISTEDDGFFEHQGVSVVGLLRAGWENYVVGGISPGRSTITQQLIKNVYICPSIAEDDCIAERTLDRKLREIAYAMELEQEYTKEQILEWYLNQISYADRYIGVQAAAEGYFRKDATELTLAEAALLAGIPAAPTAYHPRLNCAVDETGECIVDESGRTEVIGAAKERQEQVLDLMVDHGRATQAEVDLAKSEPLLIYAQRNDQIASAWIDNQVEPALVRMCNAGVLPKLDHAEDCLISVRSSGWTVTSTIDHEETRNAQSMMREAIAAGLEAGCECHNAAIVTIEPTSGEIIIYAPNRDPSYLSDERVRGDIDQLVEINQPGSAFKPVVYLTWFDLLNKAPMSIFWDTSPLAVGGATITNPRSGGSSEGLISARAALGGSQNVGAFRAAVESGPDNVIEMAKRMGITTLHQGFDPTFVSHADVQYGASIATGGANIRAVDMAYMNSVIANMGVMVGVPHYAEELDMNDLRNTAFDEGEDYDDALRQKEQFSKGHLRLPGTRELDPVVILEVRDPEGNLVYAHDEPERREVVDRGSVWLLHSIMSDCNARFIIWGCGTSNDDTRLDAFDPDGVRIPTGIKTGTQQGPLSAADTLETWMNGYSRYAATAVWVGNSDNSLVMDGPSAGYASADTTIWLFKDWMGEYHHYLKGNGAITGDYLGFDELQPGNVRYGAFKTPATDRGLSGGCHQTVTAWYRTDVTYEDPCEEVAIDVRNGLLASDQTPPEYRELREFVKLPDFREDLARKLAANPPYAPIPIAPTEQSRGRVAVQIAAPGNGEQVTGSVRVVGLVDLPDVEWTLEIGRGANPGEWVAIGGGDGRADGTLGQVSLAELDGPGVYSLRLRATSSSVGELSDRVTFNFGEEPTPTPSPTPGDEETPDPGGPTETPTPGGEDDEDEDDDD